MVSGGIGIVQFLSVVPVIIVIDRVGEEVHTPNPWSLSHSALQEGDHYYGVSVYIRASTAYSLPSTSWRRCDDSFASLHCHSGEERFQTSLQAEFDEFGHRPFYSVTTGPTIIRQHGYALRKPVTLIFVPMF